MANSHANFERPQLAETLRGGRSAAINRVVLNAYDATRAASFSPAAIHAGTATPSRACPPKNKLG